MMMVNAFVSSNFGHTEFAPGRDHQRVEEAREAFLFLSDIELSFHLTFLQRLDLMRVLKGNARIGPVQDHLESLGFSSGQVRDLSWIARTALTAAEQDRTRSEWFGALGAAGRCAGVIAIGSMPRLVMLGDPSAPRLQGKDHTTNTNDFNQNEASLPVPQPPRQASMTNFQARDWYVGNVRGIGQMIDRTQPLNQQARQAFDLRNQFKDQARDAMSDRPLADHLNRTERPLTWQQALNRYNGDWQRIIDASMRTNPGVDALFGIE